MFRNSLKLHIHTWKRLNKCHHFSLAVCEQRVFCGDLVSMAFIKKTVQLRLTKLPRTDQFNNGHSVQRRLRFYSKQLGPRLQQNEINELVRTSSSVSTIYTDHVLRFAANDDVARRSPTEPSFPQDRPNFTQLQHVKLNLEANLPYFFMRRQDYTIYSPYVIVENRLKNVTFEGLSRLVYHTAMLRMLGHIRYVFVKLKLLSILPIVEDGTVRVRWRLVHLGPIKACNRFLEFKLWNKQNTEKAADWLDGYAIYHVGGDGLVHKIVIDRVEEDPETLNQKKLTAKEVIAKRLAGNVS